MNFQSAFKIVPFVLFAFASCTSPDKPAQATDSTSLTEPETIMEQPDTVLFWTVDIEQKQKYRVYKDTAGITDPESIINGINTLYPSIRLEFVKLSGDTVYAHIDSAFTFANDLGSFGASEYIASVVINLTTLPNINYVNLDFPVGSHATPGVFAKNDFDQFIVKEE